MRVLFNGFEVEQQLQEDETNGVSQQDRQKLREFDQRLQDE